MIRRAGCVLSVVLAAGCASQAPAPGVPAPPPPPVVAVAAPVPTRTAFQADVEARVAQVLQQASGLEMVWVSDAPEGGVLIGLDPIALFAQSEAVLLPGALGGLGQLENTLLAQGDSVVQILGARLPGATCPSYRLSARQAHALESYWLALGFPASRLRAQGRDDCPAPAGGPPPAGRVQILVRRAVAGDVTAAYRPLDLP